MSDCNHRMGIGKTMYIGNRWHCLDCGQEMECVDIGEHEEVLEG